MNTNLLLQIKSDILQNTSDRNLCEEYNGKRYIQILFKKKSITLSKT
jgi:hypothetical protein